MEKQSLTFVSKSENIVLVEKMIDEVCEKFNVNEDHYGNILVALTEAVYNAILHGNKSNSHKNIEITFAPYPDHISFTVRDEGDGFDYNNLPDPTDPENIEKLQGRGVFLMKHLADKVEFSEEGRVVSLDFNIFKK